MNAKPAVSAIIVNWNGARHLRTCLPSLLSQSFTSLEVIVVDNDSKDDSAEVAREFQVRWLPLDKNAGLAPALNRGAAMAVGDFLLFINNDMRFDPGFVAALVEPLEKNEEIFATDGMQFNWDGSERGHLAARLARSRPRGRSSTELVPGLYFYQREVPEKSQVFTACMRMNFRGILQGRLLLATKLLPLRYAARTWLISTAALAKDIGRLRWQFAKDRIGTLAGLVGILPELLRERRMLFRAACITPAQQLNLLLRFSDEDADARRSVS